MMNWQDWLASSQARLAARLLTLLLALLVIYQLAQLTWELVPAPSPSQGETTAAAPPPTAPAAPAADAAPTGRIAGWHLFGEADPGPGAGGAGPAAPIDAPETRLNLTLRGLYATDQPDRARAIIAAPNNQERTYRVDDELPGGAELSAIYADRVILRRNGRFETLRLPREALEGGAAADNGQQVGSNSRAGEILAEYRGVLETNPRALIDLVRPVPVNENNEFAGFRLYPGNRPKLFQQLGLRPGDLVTRVNGVELDNAGRGVEVLQQLRDSRQISLQVRRGNQTLDLAFSVP